MPHCIIEITKRTLNDTNITQLMIDVAKAVNIDRIFKADDIKTRLYQIDDSLMGEVQQDHSYVTAEIVIFDNKTDIQKQRILNAVLDILVNYFGNQICKNSITTRLSLVNPDYYKKFNA